MTTAVLDEHQVRTFGGNVYTIPSDLCIYTIPDPLHEYYKENGWMTPDEISVCLKASGFDVEKARNDAAVQILGTFRIMTPEHGDKRVTWRRTVIAEIKAAKQMFLDLIAQGMVPYKVGVNGKASSQEMKEFDPFAEEVIFLPIKMVGGG